MGHLRNWNEAELRELKNLVLSGLYTYPEISKILGKNRSSCQQRANYMGLNNPAYINRRTKHKHLRKPLLQFYKRHSAQETAQHFGLTPAEFRSCLTLAYKDPKLSHLRKETRRHDSWELDELLFLIRHSGIQPRIWISRKLKRGGVYAVRESLNRLNTGSKFLNGIPLEWGLILFGSSCTETILKTKAGPPGGKRGNFHFKIIPWVECERLSKNKKLDPEVRIAIQAMARFQRWIHGWNDDSLIIQDIKMRANLK